LRSGIGTANGKLLDEVNVTVLSSASANQLIVTGLDVVPYVGVMQPIALDPSPSVDAFSYPRNSLVRVRSSPLYHGFFHQPI
jgi:hypothetical protein